MNSDMDFNERRCDFEKRLAVVEAVDLHRHGHLKEGIELLVECGVPAPVIIRTLLGGAGEGV